MHPVITMKHWSHSLHDGALATWHQIALHLGSRHFWTGVGATLLAIGLVALLAILTKNTPVQSRDFDPYGVPFSEHRW